MHGFERAEGGLYRLAVPGGWIYRDYDTGQMVYVPHPTLMQGGRGAAVPRPVPAVVDDPTRKAG